MGGYAVPKLETVRAAFIGVGARGGYHMKFFAEWPGAEVVAISDLYEENYSLSRINFEFKLPRVCCTI